MNVFEAFPEGISDYTFLEISRGGVAGNTILDTHGATGIFKKRSDMIRGDNSEAKDSNPTLHIRAGEAFLAPLDNNLTGHGIRHDGQDYEIIGFTDGFNFDSGQLEHYTATLQESKFAEMEGS